MRTTRILSLSLPPDLVREAERVAKQEGRTKSGCSAKHSAATLTNAGWRGLQRYGATRARKVGITEADVGRSVQEFRCGR